MGTLSAFSNQLSAFSEKGERMKNFRDLTVWQKAHQLALDVYKNTSTFPLDERYGMTSQMRRCAVSIPANISEGCGRSGDAELARFLSIAMGSASELEYFLLLARDLSLMDGPAYKQSSSQVTEVKRMLSSFLQKLSADR